MAGKIFVSYRRDDTAPFAISIAQYLENRFGKDRVFLDVDRLRAGEDFPSVLKRKLADCAVVLAIIGPNWLDAMEQRDSSRRLDNPEDWVRLEIAQAIARGVPVVPVLVAGASMPSRASLPSELQPLVDRQFAVVTTNGFRHEMAGLARDVADQIGIRPARWSVWYAVVLATALIVGVAALWFRSPGLSILGKPQEKAVFLSPNCKQIGSLTQPISANTEAAYIEQYRCSGRELWIYRYTNRQGFRLVDPPNNWRVIGNFDTYGDAVAALNEEAQK